MCLGPSQARRPASDRLVAIIVNRLFADQHKAWVSRSTTAFNSLATARGSISCEASIWMPRQPPWPMPCGWFLDFALGQSIQRPPLQHRQPLSDEAPVQRQQFHQTVHGHFYIGQFNAAIISFDAHLYVIINHPFTGTRTFMSFSSYRQMIHSQTVYGLVKAGRAYKNLSISAQNFHRGAIKCRFYHYYSTAAPERTDDQIAGSHNASPPD